MKDYLIALRGTLLLIVVPLLLLFAIMPKPQWWHRVLW